MQGHLVAKLGTLMKVAATISEQTARYQKNQYIDASQSGRGAALLQEGRPVAYSSRVMTQTEQNCAQIEKELLAIVFACEKFDQYIFGRSDVVVESDHKPLETIFKKPVHSSPKRLQQTSSACAFACRTMTY